MIPTGTFSHFRHFLVFVQFWKTFYLLLYLCSMLFFVLFFFGISFFASLASQSSFHLRMAQLKFWIWKSEELKTQWIIFPYILTVFGRCLKNWVYTNINIVNYRQFCPKKTCNFFFCHIYMSIILWSLFC